MDFNKVLKTTKKHKGINKCKYIILHHTGGGTFDGNCNILSGDKGTVSCHFVVGPNGEKAKIGNPEDILWHCGVSEWKGLEDMNKYSIGIEVVGPGFFDIQRKSTKELIIHLMNAYGIPKENVIRHKDIAPGRKIDIDDSFRNGEFKSFDDRKNVKLP